MAGWTVDRGLDKLLAQINEAAPKRSKASDGSIGDAAHAARDSDHNPEDEHDADAAGNPDEQVDARDITHDPAGGCDMGVVTEALRKSKDRRIKYVIFNRRIFSGRRGPQPWVWRPYSGSNPHTKHGHVSVEDDTHDQTQPWQIGIGDDMADVALTPAQDQRLKAIDVRLRRLVDGNADPYDVSWTDDAKDRESMWLVGAVKQLAADVAAVKTQLATTPPGAVTISDEQLERVLRKVIGSVDGVTPAA